MVYSSRIHQSLSCNPSTQAKSPQFAQRPFSIQAKQNFHKPPTQEQIENDAFNQHKFEAFPLQLKEKNGTITPAEQEQLGVLQAKMNDFWTRRMGQAKLQSNLREIPVLRKEVDEVETRKLMAPVFSTQDLTATTISVPVQCVIQRQLHQYLYQGD